MRAQANETEGVVEFGSAFPADGEALELVKQSEGLLDDVAEYAHQALDVRGALAGDDRQDAPLAQFAPVGVGVVALVAEKCVGAASRAARTSGHRRDAVDRGEGLGDAVDVGRSGDDFEWGAVSVADQVVFAARLPPVDRRRTGVGSPFFVRMWEPSTHARDQSSSLAVLSPASRMRCNWSETPACCHCSSRRQQVCPEPNPSSSGRSCQAMSLWRTYRMPCRHSRSATCCGSGDFSGQGGSNGSISAHKPSSTIHGRALTPSRTAESSHRSRPTWALQQDRVTSSKPSSDPERFTPARLIAMTPNNDLFGSCCRAFLLVMNAIGPAVQRVRVVET